MSRIGKLPITIPTGVSVEQVNNTFTVKGPKGELSAHFLPVTTVTITDGIATVTRKDDSIEARAAHGLTRQLLANMITGVSEGFEKRLEMKGVGYRAAAEGDKKLVLSVGFSHPVPIDAPDHVTFKVEKNIIVISGIDKQVVGQIAAVIRDVRPPEPYKGKGIMYLGEKIRRKAGKAAKAGS
jgi:large subunit ribosomal protein L6